MRIRFEQGFPGPKDNNEVPGPNPTGCPRADELAQTEVKDKDWLLECEDVVSGKQTRPAGQGAEEVQYCCAWSIR